MPTKHFINLTNGIEHIPELHRAGIAYAFIRIQSTACEQKRWDALIAELDSNFLMSLALGEHCIVYDYSNKREVPRAMWQGLELVKFCLYRFWFDRMYPVHSNMRSYFEKIYHELSPSSVTKLKYFRKFLLTDGIFLDVVTARTTRDGQIAFYRMILEQDRTVAMQPLSIAS